MLNEPKLSQTFESVTYNVDITLNFFLIAINVIILHQADIKLEGISHNIVQAAIQKGVVAQRKILDVMDKTQKEPRATRKVNGPLLEDLNIPANKHKNLLGYGGINMKRLTAETGLTISKICYRNITTK